MIELTAADAIVLTALVTATVTDLQTQKIPNVLTGSLVAVGVLYNFATGEYWLPIIGIVTAFALYFGLFALSVVRAGDGKLMIGVGAVMGWSMMLESTLWSFALFAPVGLGILIARGRFGNFLETLKYAYRKALRYPVEPPSEKTYMAFAPVILCGVIAARFTEVLTVWETP